MRFIDIKLRISISILRRTPNFEDILYALSSLAATSPAGILASAPRAFVLPRHLPNIIHIRTPAPADSNVLRHLSQRLVDSILEDFRSRCLKRSRRLIDLKCFFIELQREFDLAVVTTNYDDLVYRALPSGIETGFDAKGNFDAGRILERTSWPCILHLHGSVHFDMRVSATTGDLHRIYWEDDLAKCRQNSSGRSAHRTTEGHEFPTSSIIAGYGKTEQIQHLPFRAYYSEIDRLVYRSEAVLFLGCGFADTHLTEAFEDYGDGRSRHVVVIDYAEDHVMTAGSRDPHAGSPAAYRAMEVFKTAPHYMRWLGYQHPANVGKLRAAMEFERSASPQHHLGTMGC